MELNKENAANDILADLAARNENWTELDGSIATLADTRLKTLLGGNFVPQMGMDDTNVVSGRVGSGAASQFKGIFLTPTRVVVHRYLTYEDRRIEQYELQGGTLAQIGAHYATGNIVSEETLLRINDTDFFRTSGQRTTLDLMRTSASGVSLISSHTIAASEADAVRGFQVCWMDQPGGVLAVFNKFNSQLKAWHWDGSTLSEVFGIGYYQVATGENTSAMMVGVAPYLVCLSGITKDSIPNQVRFFQITRNKTTGFLWNPNAPYYMSYIPSLAVGFRVMLAKGIADGGFGPASVYTGKLLGTYRENASVKDTWLDGSGLCLMASSTPDEFWLEKLYYTALI